MPKPFELPIPSDAALAHSGRLVALIRERLAECGGWIDFAEYMDLALNAPGLGYYSAGAVKLGPGGDFITAPELSPLFARCVARTCAPLLASDPDSVILEIGAGTGSMAAELMAALGRRGTLPARYLILETSADLRERQRSRLTALEPRVRDRVEWLEQLPRGSVRGVAIANEVADALPFNRFCVQDGAVLDCGVADTGTTFTWAPRPAGATLRAEIEAITTDIPLADGYRSEISLRLRSWIAAIATVFETGAILLFDYGCSRREYYHPDRRDGTLLCHYRHRAHGDPFLYPGLQDITAWVDFTAVAEAADAAGLNVGGYATQAHFLLDTGLSDEIANLQSAGIVGRVRARHEANALVLPGEMGERVKVIALTRGVGPLPGFGFRDLRHLL